MNGGEGFDINLPVRYDLDVIRPNLGRISINLLVFFVFIIF
jgi:hypothetical protein